MKPSKKRREYEKWVKEYHKWEVLLKESNGIDWLAESARIRARDNMNHAYEMMKKFV